MSNVDQSDLIMTARTARNQFPYNGLATLNTCTQVNRLEKVYTFFHTNVPKKEQKNTHSNIC